MIVNNFPSRTIKVDNGKEYLYFGGTSYLGMSIHPEFQKILSKNLTKWGVFYGSSRNSNIQLAIYEEFEQHFSKYIGAESSVTMSSGMLAGKLTIEHLSKTIKTFFHYPKSHPAILKQGSLPIYIEGKLHPKLLDDTSEEIVISVDAILSMEVKPTAFDFMSQIPSHKKITLIVDESHSLGIIGERGEGVFSEISNQNLHRKIMISSLGKALSLPAGIIASDQEFIIAIKNDAIFVSASGACPAHLETYLQTVHLYNTQYKKLKNNLAFLFQDESLDSVYKYDKQYPVIYTEKNNIYNLLFENEIIITHFEYPSYNTIMNRIVITANHTQEDLIKLKNALIVL